MSSLATRSPRAVVRQFARAICADRLLGDELVRLTMARHPEIAEDAEPETWLEAFLSTWLGEEGRGEGSADAARWSDAGLRAALPPPPSPDRLLLLLTDVLGVEFAQAAELARFSGDPRDAVAIAREQLSVPPDQRALVIEDEPITATELASLLSRLGFETVEVAASADRAVALAVSNPPDLILADYDLPGGKTGVDAVRTIRQRTECPVIFVTAYPDNVLRGHDREPDFVIAKPFEPVSVRAAAAYALAPRALDAPAADEDND